MTLSKIQSISLLGLEAVPVDVEVDARSSDKFCLVIVGLPDTAVRESKDRVLTALKNSEYSVGVVHSTVNLAPGDLKKEGPIYDLPIAIGLLRSMKMLIEKKNCSDYLLVGELGLGGQLRPTYGAIAIALLARQMGKKGVILPAANAKEAASVPGIDIFGINNLREAVDFFQGKIQLKLTEPSHVFNVAQAAVDFADIKGQTHAKRALEISIAGGHNTVLIGPPGSGKTLLAKSLVGIMPEFTIDEALETTKIHSIAGLLPEGQSLVVERPFRSPHHTISYAGLIGGGTIPKPGEVSLSHNGVLFLDEFPEFARSVLEVLRQPLEDRQVTISRANGNFTFPTNFILIAAMNPCPCGMLGHPTKGCKDSSFQIDRYRSKISGPLWDRMDMHIEVPALKHEEYNQQSKAESSAVVRMRIKQARIAQHKRFKKSRTNSLMTTSEIKLYCALNSSCLSLMQTAVQNMNLSSRAYDRIIRVARTIADLENQNEIAEAHLMEAISFRDTPVHNL